MKDENWVTIRKIKSGTATGPGCVSVELLETLQELIRSQHYLTKSMKGQIQPESLSLYL